MVRVICESINYCYIGFDLLVRVICGSNCFVIHRLDFTPYDMWNLSIKLYMYTESAHSYDSVISAYFENMNMTRLLYTNYTSNNTQITTYAFDDTTCR